MKDFFAQHGVQASVVLVLALFNIVLSAVKSGIEKLESFLLPAPGAVPDPSSSLEKVKALVVKLLGWSSSIIDWLTGNLAH